MDKNQEKCFSSSQKRLVVVVPDTLRNLKLC
jgi:hypothetical protein